MAAKKKTAPHDPRVAVLGEAIDVHDGAPAEDAEIVLSAALAELTRRGCPTTRDELLAIAVERFAHHFDFAALVAKHGAKRVAPAKPRAGKGRPAKSRRGV